MILRPVRPASPSGPPITNLPVGLMYQHAVVGDLEIAERLADIGLDDLADLLRIPAGIEMLGRQHDLRGLGGLAVDVADGDLALGVRAELAGVAAAFVAGRRPAVRGSCGCSRSAPASGPASRGRHSRT